MRQEYLGRIWVSEGVGHARIAKVRALRFRLESGDRPEHPTIDQLLVGVRYRRWETVLPVKLDARPPSTVPFRLGFGGLEQSRNGEIHGIELPEGAGITIIREGGEAFSRSFSDFPVGNRDSMSLVTESADLSYLDFVVEHSLLIPLDPGLAQVDLRDCRGRRRWGQFRVRNRARQGHQPSQGGRNDEYSVFHGFIMGR